MGRRGLLVGEVIARSGISRKALRLYEAAGIVPPPHRTAAGYRVFDEGVLALLGFVAQARRLGFTLAEIKEIVAIKRSGRAPCGHVRRLVRRRAEELNRALADLVAVRRRLRTLLGAWDRERGGRAAVCPHIEHREWEEKEGGRHGEHEGIAVPRVQCMPRSRG